jgi:hypothetical protein
MSWVAGVVHMVQKRVLMGKYEGKERLEDIGVDMRIILK